MQTRIVVFALAAGLTAVVLALASLAV